MKVYKVYIEAPGIEATAIVAARCADTALIALGRYIGEQGTEMDANYFNETGARILTEEIEGMSYDKDAKCIFFTREYLD